LDNFKLKNNNVANLIFKIAYVRRSMDENVMKNMNTRLTWP
jgi:hypothetical protein